MKLALFMGLVLASGFGNVACADGSGAMDSVQAAQAMPGQFVSVGSHAVVGTAKIEKREAGTFLVFGDDFLSDAGPDLRLVLRDSTGVTMMEVVAPLKMVQGAQEYQISLANDLLAKFDEIVIYCAQFHVDFGIAKISQ